MNVILAKILSGFEFLINIKFAKYLLLQKIWLQLFNRDPIHT